MDALVCGLERRWPLCLRMLRIFTVTSPKSMFTGQGVTQRWQTVQWSATSFISSQWCSEIPRRVCSS
ncbi:hypothetical protein KBTX_03788 [wastewater metagenome]|uniref:Uncharacterized protein n=2 Tax=unclassified sequences TaxID=12908 RepID=A0A5B8RKH5_9ZZZZ|nr:hypothetical protein KBTEX_03788 [uncultured organism]